MAQITREEIREALELCLGEGFEPTYDELDLADPVVIGRDLVRYSAYILLQNPDSQFFLAKLFSEKLEEDVEDLVDDLEDSIDAVSEFIVTYTEPDSKPLDKATDALKRAKNAADEGEFSQYSVSRAATKMREYADGLGDQLLGTGTFSRPSDYAKSIVQTFISGLEDRLSDVLDRVTVLRGAALDKTYLEKIAAFITMNRVLEALEDKKEDVDAGTELESELKSLYLFLRAAESTLTSSDEYPDPDADRASGTCAPNNNPPTEAAERVVPASITGDQTMPLVNTDASVDFTVNSSVHSCSLPVCTQPSMTGVKSGPFNFWADSQAIITSSTGGPFNFAVNRPWCVYVDGVAYTGTIASGAYATAALMGAHLSAVLTNPIYGSINSQTNIGAGAGMLLVIAFFDGVTGFGRHSIIIPNDTRYNNASNILGFGPPYGIDTEDLTDARSVEGRAANNTMELVLDAGAAATATITTGAAVLASTVATDITATSGVPANATPSNYIEMYSNTYGDGGRVRVDSGPAADVLGFFEGQEIRSQHKYAPDYVSSISKDLDGYNGKATSESVVRTTGEGTTVVGVGSEDLFDLAVGDGAAVSVGDAVMVLDGPNMGAYEITGVAGDRVTLDRDQFVTAGPVSQRYKVLYEALTVESTETSTLLSNVEASIAAGAKFGILTLRHWGSVSDVKTSDSLLHARLGDTLNLPTSTHTIEKIKDDILVLDSNVEMNLGSVAFTITSSDAASHSTMITDLGTWYASAADAWDNLSALNAAFNKARITPSLANRTQLESQLGEIKDLLVGTGSLLEILGNYECRVLPAVENLLKTLEERKLDFGAQKLRDLEFDEFFQFDNAMSYAEEAYQDLASFLGLYYPGDSVDPYMDEEVIDVSGTATSSIPEYGDMETLEGDFVVD